MMTNSIVEIKKCGEKPNETLDILIQKYPGKCPVLFYSVFDLKTVTLQFTSGYTVLKDRLILLYFLS